MRRPETWNMSSSHESLVSCHLDRIFCFPNCNFTPSLRNMLSSYFDIFFPWNSTAIFCENIYTIKLISKYNYWNWISSGLAINFYDLSRHNYTSPILLINFTTVVLGFEITFTLRKYFTERHRFKNILSLYFDLFFFIKQYYAKIYTHTV